MQYNNLLENGNKDKNTCKITFYFVNLYLYHSEPRILSLE